MVAEFLNYSDVQHNKLPIDNFQISQAVGNVCTPLNYTIFSNQSHEDVTLFAEKPDRINTRASPPIISVTLPLCPPGFKLRGSHPHFKCDCTDKLFDLQIDCNIDNRTVQRPPTTWIGYHYGFIVGVTNTTTDHDTSSAGILLHKHCPFDYCKNEELDIKLSYSDEQCAFNRSGILCGACNPGLSLALATSRCLECSNVYLSLTAMFLLAGMLLVFTLTALDLTVSEGTINGLIFYANIVHTNKAIFFPSKAMYVFSIFIAWLNLDLGIETCFFNGMDMYARTWLQFAFPLYIWAIVFAMIVSSRYSTLAGKLFGRNNSVRVLATLFLLSYTKILRTIITALSFTTLTYPDESVKFLWLADANIQYLTGKHIPLFMVALLFLLFLSLPYTALLLFLQCLWPRSHFRILCWMRKIKPFLDAHTGPYKDKYRFWIGLLFLARITLFMGFAANSLGDPSLNLLFVAIMIMCLFGYKWIVSGIYKNWLFDALEASFFLNLGVLSVATSYIQSSRSEAKLQNVISGVSVGTALVTFLGIVIYHTRHHMPQTVLRIKDGLLYCYTCGRKKYDIHTNNAELEELVADNEDGANIAISGESPAQTQPKVQCLRLTFDRNVTSGEAVLVEEVED